MIRLQNGQPLPPFLAVEGVIRTTDDGKRMGVIDIETELNAQVARIAELEAALRAMYDITNPIGSVMGSDAMKATLAQARAALKVAP